jgi:hypothetical protein
MEVSEMSIDNVARPTRRGVLAAAVGGLAALAANALGRPAALRADNGDAVLLGQTNFSTTFTGITQENDTGVVALACVTAGSGPGVHGHSEKGYGVQGTSNASAGVYGRGISVGVHGEAISPTGTGVFAENTNVSNVENYGLAARTLGSLGRAVFGWSRSTGGGTGVWGQTDAGTGAAVRGYAWDSDGATGKFGTGVIGTSGSHAFPPPAPLPNTGVYGIGINGRGGVFKGDKAQVRLVASSASTHPSSGILGDLFLDQNKRLWFCKGGAIWTQIA